MRIVQIRKSRLFKVLAMVLLLVPLLYLLYTHTNDKDKDFSYSAEALVSRRARQVIVIVSGHSKTNVLFLYTLIFSKLFIVLYLWLDLEMLILNK